MEIIKDYLRGLPEVGFHRWQSYLSLFSLKRPNKGLFSVRWAFPLAWIKERLKRLYFARGGLPSLAVLPKVFFQRWASILNNGGLSSMTAKGRLRGCKESSRLPGLAELPKVGFEESSRLRKVCFSLMTAKGGLFSFGGLPGLAELPKVGLISPLVGFLGFDGIIIPLKPEKPLFGLYTVLYGEKVGFEASKVGLSPLVLNTFIYIHIHML